MTSHKNILDQRIGDIASRDQRKADVLIKYGLDFCCNGKQTLRNAIKSAGISSTPVTKELKNYNDADILPSRNMYFWSIDFLCDFVVHTHHQYVRNTATMLREYGSVVVNNHQKNHPELRGVQEVVELILKEMDSHMKKEEEDIFPAMKKLWTMYIHPDKIDRHLKSVKVVEKNFVDLENEHNTVWRQINAIREMTLNYAAPADACVTYQIYLTKLKEFHEDLINHVHIENNILFPKVVALASKFH